MEEETRNSEGEFTSPEEEPTNPWDRQPDEPILWFDRFDRCFRLLGTERTLLAAYRIWHKEGGYKTASSYSSWKDYARKWYWPERAEAWDEAERRERLRAEEEARAKMLREHIAMARAIWGQGLSQLKRMIKEEVALTPSEARIYIKDGITLERQARGLPEYLLEIAQLSDEELLGRYTELFARYASPGSVDGGDAEAGDNSADASPA